MHAGLQTKYPGYLESYLYIYVSKKEACDMKCQGELLKADGLEKGSRGMPNYGKGEVS